MTQLSGPPPPPPHTGTPQRPKRLLRWLTFVFAAVLGLALIAGNAGWFWLQSRLNASLPQLDGAKAVDGLSSPVEIERDELGVPTIRASSRVDAVKALGFVHAQDRFFQMDLLRRQGAAELAEIFGPAAAQSDRQRRIHRFRDMARRTLAQLPADDRALLSAYASGVNAGVSALSEKPFEYLVLRSDLAPWQPEDSMLVFYAMFFELHDEVGRGESNLGYLHDTLPPEMFQFVAPHGTEWDAPLIGEAVAQPPVPGPSVFDLRQRPASLARTRTFHDESDEPIMAAGSNNWAVAGTHSADGHAWLANDMHMALGVPNIVYRVSVIRPDEAGGRVRITGATLPGAPVIVAGSNGHVAWGLTNAPGDWTDLVVLERHPSDPDMYRSPEGWRRFEHARELIKIKGSTDQSLEIKQTIWGPVIDADHRGRARVLAWTAHHPEAVNLELANLEQTQTVAQALDVAKNPTPFLPGPTVPSVAIGADPLISGLCESSNRVE